MSEKEFEKAMLKLRKRIHLMKLAKTGGADVQRVKVSEYVVREHKVRSHTRVYYRLKKAA